MQRIFSSTRRGLSSSVGKRKNVVVVDGVRIPFTMAGSVYGKYLAVDLGRMALKGLLTKTALQPEMIDYLYFGTVIQETRTSNIAREAAMGAGIPYSVPSHTISMACISSNQCITTGAEKVRGLSHGRSFQVPCFCRLPILQRNLQLNLSLCTHTISSQIDHGRHG